MLRPSSSSSPPVTTTLGPLIKLCLKPADSAAAVFFSPFNADSILTLSPTLSMPISLR
jgi:hypothetical protein